MKPFEYPAVAYRQSRDPKAPWLVSIVAASEDILTWAGIPRRSENVVLGFQRAMDPDRTSKAKEYFNLGNNQSPTALVVGLHPLISGDQQAVRLSGVPTEQGSGSDDSETEAQPIITNCTLTIQLDPTVAKVTSALAIDPNLEIEEADVAHIVGLVRRQLEFRLANGASDTTDNPDEEDVEDVSGVVEDDLPGDESDLDVGDDIEIGRSLLTKLRDQLEDFAWCRSNIDALCDLAKPATVIDGQHRVKAAQMCERKIPFAVCAIYDCQWPEQVFQFTVVNYTARGIPDQFITANAALSLTKSELDELQDRLVQAGVKVVEYELMRVVNFDRNSPFFDLVNLSEKSRDDRIGYKTMVRVAKTWYDANHPALKSLLLPHLYPDIQGRGAHKTRLTRWKEEDWGKFFLAFWKVVHAEYVAKSSHSSGRNLWDVGHSNLLIAIVLFELQEAFLRNLNAQDEEYFETSTQNKTAELLGKIENRARKFVSYIPPEFFGTEWKLKSLSTGVGRDALSSAIRGLVDNKGKFAYANTSLHTGNVA